MDIPGGEARTIESIIAEVDDVCPNSFTSSVKTRWIARLDMLLWRDLFLQEYIAELDYTWPECKDWQVLIAAPDDDIYDLYVRAQIEFHNGEAEKYLNSAAFYDARYREFAAWFINAYQPAQGYEGWESIYNRSSLRRWRSGW
ncbi:MAG: hypothetical protein LBS51_08540 [Oscillospiraceae bacterium]|jgi:hypothetical protein|nr:hypothetical protein [Oscillospiraceae bacterium]